MVFNGVSKIFKLTDEQQYDTIGQFWDEMSMQYGRENLRGLGYRWKEDTLYYAIGLKNGNIKEENVSILLPDDGWVTVRGQTSCLKELYADIYKDGILQYEIETFSENGTCEISYYRQS